MASNMAQSWAQPKKERPCSGLWLFHLHSAVKIQPFYPVFPLAGATDKAFCRLSLWSFKEKKHQPFSITQPSRITEPCAGQRGFRPDKKPFPVHYRGEGLNQPLTIIKGTVSPPSPGRRRPCSTARIRARFPKQFSCPNLR